MKDAELRLIALRALPQGAEDELPRIERKFFRHGLLYEAPPLNVFEPLHSSVKNKGGKLGCRCRQEFADSTNGDFDHITVVLFEINRVLVC